MAKGNMGKDLYRPQGLITRGSGRTDPTSPEGLNVDDVPAILGKDEFVINSNTVKKVGVDFLENLNNIGLNDFSPIKPDTLGYESKYQKGGGVNLNSKPAVGIPTKGMTTFDDNHKHEYFIDRYGNGYTYTDNDDGHNHSINNYQLSEPNGIDNDFHTHNLTNVKTVSSMNRQEVKKTKPSIGGSKSNFSVKKVYGFKGCNNSNDCNYPVDICINNQCFPNYSHYYGAIDYNETSGKVTFNDWGLETSHDCCIESSVCPAGTRCEQNSCKCVSV